MVEINIGDLHSHINCDAGLLSYLSKYLRQQNDYWARQHNPHIPKYKYYITKKGQFLTGFLPRVATVLRNKGVKFKLIDERSVKGMPDLGEVKILLDSMEVEGNPLKLRDYQLDALVEGLRNTMGVFDLATGSGKGILIASLMLAWRKKTLVVINSKDLAKQLQRELSDYTQMPVGFIGDGIWDPQDYTVAIDKSLVSKKKAKEYMKSVEYLIYDEVHHIQSKTWRKIARSCTNAGLRHGFSGTPETSEVKREGKKAGNNDMLIEGYIGPTIAQVKTRDLIEMGYLSDCKVFVVNNELYFDNNCLAYADEQRRIILKDEERNEILCEVLSQGYEAGLQCIGFVERIEHGEEIRDMLVNQFNVPEEEIAFAHGNSCSRDDDLAAFKDGEVSILYGTILNEGLNFICDLGVLMGGGKSRKDLKQRIGRILRKPKTDTGDVDKDEERFVLFFDLADSGHPWFAKHRRRRVKTYKEDGYEVEFIDREEIDVAQGTKS